MAEQDLERLRTQLDKLDRVREKLHQGLEPDSALNKLLSRDLAKAPPGSAESDARVILENRLQTRIGELDNVVNELIERASRG